jgi:cytochrome P450
MNFLQVLANIYAVHMDPAVWHNPSTFRPERFLNEEGEVTGKEQIIPFSTGQF